MAGMPGISHAPRTDATAATIPGTAKMRSGSSRSCGRWVQITSCSPSRTYGGLTITLTFSSISPNTDEAIEHLEELRAAGAEYLVFPSSSFWWLDHYSSFGTHLRSRYRIVVYQEDTCIVFRLAERRVADVVRYLLPAESRMTVVTSLAGDLSGLGQYRAIQL